MIERYFLLHYKVQSLGFLQICWLLLLNHFFYVFWWQKHDDKNCAFFLSPVYYILIKEQVWMDIRLEYLTGPNMQGVPIWLFGPSWVWISDFMKFENHLRFAQAVQSLMHYKKLGGLLERERSALFLVKLSFLRENPSHTDRNGKK